MCAQATILRTQVNNSMLNVGDLLKDVLNGSFNLSLPTTFKKIVNANPADYAKQSYPRVVGEGNSRDKKKGKSKHRNSNLVRDMSQDNNLKLQKARRGKTPLASSYRKIAQLEKIKKCAQDGTSEATAMTTAHVQSVMYQRRISLQKQKQIFSLL
jgi:hypothetical protein